MSRLGMPLDPPPYIAVSNCPNGLVDSPAQRECMSHSLIASSKESHGRIKANRRVAHELPAEHASVPVILRSRLPLPGDRGI